MSEFRGLRLAGEELRNITSGVSRLSGEVGRLKTAAEPIIRLDKERPLAPTLDQLKGAVANLGGRSYPTTSLLRTFYLLNLAPFQRLIYLMAML